MANGDKQNGNTPLPEDDEALEMDAMLAEAETLAQEGRLEEATQLLETVIERFPESPLPHHALSVVYLSRLRKDYEHLELWENLANDEELFELAVSEAEAALELDPDFVPARNNLGTLCAYRGWWEDAIAHWERSLAISPDQPLIREDLARVRERAE